MIKLNYPLNIFNSTLKAFVSLYNVAPWKSAVSGPTALINLELQTKCFYNSYNIAYNSNNKKQRKL